MRLRNKRAPFPLLTLPRDTMRAGKDLYLILGAVGAGLLIMSSKKDLGTLVAEQLNAGANVDALMAVIRQHESAHRYDATYADNVTGFRITDFSDHPANLGWRGVRLGDSTCIAAGFSPGCVSTAAGAYQFIKPTWNGLVARYGFPDFSNGAQDAAAFALLSEIGAVDLVQAGDVEGALRLASKQWASMPYSTSGQPKANLATVLDEFQSFGGVIA